MNENKISVRYSKALFQIATEKGVADEVMYDIQMLSKAYDEPHLHHILHSPAVKASKKKEYIHTLFNDEINEVTFDFLNLLIDNKRETFLKRITKQFVLLYNKHHHIKMVLLTTANKIDDDLRNQIVDLVKNHYQADVDIRECVNPELLGGFILNIDDYQFDGSMTTQLQKIRKQFKETSFLN